MKILAYFTPRNMSLFVVLFAALCTIVIRTTGFDLMRVFIILVLGFIVLLLSHGLVKKFFSLPLFAIATAEPLPEKERIIIVPEIPAACADRFEAAQEESLRKEVERRKDILKTVKEYVTEVSAGFLSKRNLAVLLSNVESMARGETDNYHPLGSDMEKKLKSPDLRHLAWNIGERFGVSRRERAVFIKRSFPNELCNAELAYIEANLRDPVPSHIIIDLPDKGDYHFHLQPQ